MLLRGTRVAAARVSIVDAGETLTGTTDADGRFAIVGISHRRLAFLMEDPAYRYVKIRIEAAGVEPIERSVKKSTYSSADIDFGSIELGNL